MAETGHRLTCILQNDLRLRRISAQSVLPNAGCKSLRLFLPLVGRATSLFAINPPFPRGNRTADHAAWRASAPTAEMPWLRTRAFPGADGRGAVPASSPVLPPTPRRVPQF